MKSERRVEPICILLLMSLGIWLQAFAAMSQARDGGRGPAGDLVQGAQEPQSLDSLSPATNKESYQKALVDFRAGRLKQAAQELRPLHSAVARNKLGIVLESMGEHDAALTAFQNSLQLQPDFVEASYNAAKLLTRLGRPNAAIYLMQSTLKRCQTRDNVTFHLRLLLAETEAYAGNDKRAAEILKDLAIERPDSAEVRYNLALTYGRLNSYPEAVKQFHEELRIKPGDPAGLLGLAKALLDMKQSSATVPYLDKYVRLRPHDAQGYYALGYALQGAGRFKEAVGMLSQAAKLSPKDYDIRFHLGMAMWKSGQLEAALLQFEAAERLKPQKAQVHSALARILWSLGRKEQAAEENSSAERLSSRKSQNDRASYCIANGNLLLQHGDLKGAEEQFRKATTLNPQNAGARYNLGLVLAHLSDPEGARHEFQKAVSLDPRLALAYNAMGLSYKKQGQFSRAADAFQQAIRINPQYAEAKNNLGTLYATLGKDDKAAALFKEATEDSPDYPVPFLNWGLLLANQGNLNAAKEMFERALQISPNLTQARKDLQIVNQTLQKETQ